MTVSGKGNSFLGYTSIMYFDERKHHNDNSNSVLNDRNYHSSWNLYPSSSEKVKINLKLLSHHITCKLDWTQWNSFIWIPFSFSDFVSSTHYLLQLFFTCLISKSRNLRNCYATTILYLVLWQLNPFSQVGTLPPDWNSAHFHTTVHGYLLIHVSILLGIKNFRKDIYFDQLFQNKTETLRL